MGYKKRERKNDRLIPGADKFLPYQCHDNIFAKIDFEEIILMKSEEIRR